MPNTHLDSLIKNRMAQSVILLFTIITVWWIALNPLLNSDLTSQQKYVWGSTYQILALLGAIYGFIIAKSWGGLKSTFGKALIFFSLGLLFQVFGQSVYSYYNLVARIEAPYPSIGDIGYFGSVIMYICGAFLLTKLAGSRISLRSLGNKFLALLIPLGILIASYLFFLRQYEFDFSYPLKVFLDFGYPLGQAFYVSLAILALILSRKVLGGIMRKPIIFFIAALLVQYFSDFNFLYQANQGAWYVGGIGDFLYSLSYLLMALSIIYTKEIFDHIRTT